MGPTPGRVPGQGVWANKVVAPWQMFWLRHHFLYESLLLSDGLIRPWCDQASWHSGMLHQTLQTRTASCSVARPIVRK